MKKDAYYFTHDSNSRNDVKILKLRRIHGNEGYGLFWMLIEILREQNNFRCSLSSLKELAFDFRTSEEILLSIIKNFELFTIDNNDFFYSESLCERMKPLEQKREKMRELAYVRWNKTSNNQKGNAYALPVHSISNASKVKKSKVKKSIIKDENLNHKKINHKKFYESELKKSNNDKQYTGFIDWLYKDNPNKKPLSKVLSMSDQITFDRFKEYIKAYNKNILKETILNLENYTKKTYKSFNLTLNNWLKKEVDNNISIKSDLNLKKNMEKLKHIH